MVWIGKALQERGVETCVLFPADGERRYEEFLIQCGFPYIRTRLPPLRAASRVRANLEFALDLPMQIRRIVRILHTGAFDLVHANGLTNIAPVVAGILAGKAVVWHWNDTLTPAWFASLVKPLLRARQCRLVVASQSVWDAYRLAKYRDRYLGVLPAPVPPAEKEGVSEGVGEIGVRPIIGFVGHLVAKKGALEFVQTIARLNALGTVVTGVMAGGILPGHEAFAEDLRKLIDELGISDKVFLLGYRQDVGALMRRFDVLLFPSHSEAAPIAVLQAMSLGVPIVATPVGNVPELFATLRMPLVAVGDVEAMSAAVCQLLLMDDPMRRSYAAAARNLIADRFSTTSVATRHLDVYQKALTMSRQ